MREMENATVIATEIVTTSESEVANSDPSPYALGFDRRVYHEITMKDAAKKIWV